MKLNNDYARTVEKIHVPQALKEQVLAAAREQAAGEGKSRPGKYRARPRLLPRLTAAAILLVLLPVAAYAALRYTDLKEYLSRSGMEDLQAVEEMNALVQTTAPEGQTRQTEDDGYTWYENAYARCAVTEAVCDSGSIYLAALIQPVSEDFFLIPSGVFLDDAVGNLGLPGVTSMDQTVAEYAASLGKTPVSVSVGYWWQENYLGGAQDFQCYEDGSVSIFFSAANITGQTQFALDCALVSVTENMDMEENLAVRKEFQIQIRDQSTIQETTFTQFDPALAEDLGAELELLSVTLEQTEMGVYASFRYREAEGSEGFNFALLDSAGQELPGLPAGGGYDHRENEDGTFTETKAYQNPDSLEGLTFRVRRFADGEVFGPYTFE